MTIDIQTNRRTNKHREHGTRRQLLWSVWAGVGCCPEAGIASQCNCVHAADSLTSFRPKAGAHPELRRLALGTPPRQALPQQRRQGPILGGSRRLLLCKLQLAPQSRADSWEPLAHRCIGEEAGRPRVGGWQTATEGLACGCCGIIHALRRNSSRWSLTCSLVNLPTLQQAQHLPHGRRRGWRGRLCSHAALHSTPLIAWSLEHPAVSAHGFRRSGAKATKTFRRPRATQRRVHQ
jgi:hypothetical protein